MERVTYQAPLADQIYDIVLEAICSGKHAIGERLSQEQIAQNLNVSRQPVLQALGLLKSQGFLCNAGRRGLMVAPLEMEFVLDLYEYRAAIDLLAAGKAARRCTPELAKLGQRFLEQGGAAKKAGSLIKLSVADMAFHEWVYLVAGNRLVIDTMNHFWNHTRRVMCVILSMDGEWPDRAWKEHKAIYSAIVAGNGELAEHLASAHVEKASESLRGRLKDRLQNATSEVGRVRRARRSGDSWKVNV